MGLAEPGASSHSQEARGQGASRDVVPPASRLAVGRAASGTWVHAVRGAATVEPGTDVAPALAELVAAILARNALVPGSVVCWLVALTGDLMADADQAMIAATDLADVPSIVIEHARVRGELPRTVRVLLHVLAEKGAVLAPVYVGEAKRLRPDLR
jgi:monofunctional chorismate mutase